MTCTGTCWEVIGSDKIYNLSNDGFRVYLNRFGVQAFFPEKFKALRLDSAKEKKFELHYEVKGICNEIPGSVWNYMILNSF